MQLVRVRERFRNKQMRDLLVAIVVDVWIGAGSRGIMDFGQHSKFQNVTRIGSSASN